MGNKKQPNPRTDGRALIPEFLIAMTKGEDAAVPLARLRPGEL